MPLQTAEGFRRLLDGMVRRIRLILSRGVVSRVDSSKRLQELQVVLLAGETRSRVEHFEPLGLTAAPEPGAEVVAGFLGGDRTHATILAVVDRRYRPTGLVQGELTIYEPVAGGSTIRFLTNGDVEITPRSGRVLVQGDADVSGDAIVAGDAIVTGSVEDAAGTMQELRDLYNVHIHAHGTPNTGPPTPQQS